MWAIRKASVRIKFQPFSSVTFRGSYAKSEILSPSYTYNSGFSVLPPHISHRSLTLKRFYSQNSSIEKRSFSSPIDFSATGDEVHESDGDVISEDDQFEYEDDIAEGRRASSGLYNAIIESSSKWYTCTKAVDKLVEEGNELSRKEISLVMSKLRRQRMYQKAFELSEWLEAQENVKFNERDYATRVDLVAKVCGLQNAEGYIEEMIPESFRGVPAYQALLANYVLNNNVTKAEQIFNKIKKLKLPITTFACEQMLLLYKRTDRRKMADVFLFMEKVNVKPSTFTYRLLIDIKGKSNDLAGMEQIVEDMKGEELEPDLKFQAELARHYVNFGVIGKAKAVLKEMEGDNLNEKRWFCSYLLPIYASLGSLDDVKRIWKICETDPQHHECMTAIDAFGKLKKVEEAEAVFNYMSEKWVQHSAKNYTAMLKVYANNKMFSEGMNIVERICGIGPEILDVIVKFYIEANEIEQACLYLNTYSPNIKGKPIFSTYMMMLDEYAKRGDVYNAELIIERMRDDGYLLCLRQYNSLLQAYIIAKETMYGFRKRLEADGIIPTKFMEARLARVDVL